MQESLKTVLLVEELYLGIELRAAGLMEDCNRRE
jgi:hypothetical protein